MKRILKNISIILTGKEKKKAAFLILLNLIVSVIDILSLAALLFIINIYTLQSVSARTTYLPAWLSDRNSILLIFLFTLFFILKSIGGFLVFQAQNRFVYHVASRISQANLIRYLNGAYSNYVNVDSSVHIRKIIQQPTEFCHYILAGVQQIISEGILICLTIFAILIFNAKLFLLLFVVLLPAVIAIAYLTKTRLKSVRMHIKTYGEKAFQYLQEALSGFIESNIYLKNSFFVKRFADYQQVHHKFQADLVVAQGMSSRLIEAFAVIGLFILIAANRFLGNTYTVELVTIGAFIAAAYKIIPGIVRILNISGQIRTFEFTIHDLLEELREPDRNKIDHGEKKIHSVSFDNVSLNYNDLEILRDFNLQINEGEFIVISGLSGSGKTTLLNILLGFLEPDKGVIRFNDKALKAYERQSYWRNIAYVKQQAFLIYDTILSNITLDKDPLNEEKLKEVVDSSGLLELLKTFPGGLQNIITENGKNISGGQKKRIAIARALYKESDIIILDEPFNELDEESERAILSHFRQLTKTGKIIILITHNLKNLSFSNQIISLNE